MKTGLTIVMALALMLAGCPDGAQTTGPTTECRSVGDKCRLGGGQLGICTMDTAGELRCASQH